MSERTGRSSTWLLGTLVFVALYWIFALGVLRTAVPAPLDDVWEDGIIARLLADGTWLRSLMLYPPLWGLRDPETLTIPVLVHGPLLPFLLVIPVQLFGTACLDGIAWFGAVAAFLTAIALFRLAARWFGDAIAAAAVCLFTVSPVVLEAVRHSLSVVVGAWLLTLTLDLLARERPRTARAGFAAGLGYLARPEMLVALPVFLLVPARPEPGSRRWFLIAFLLVGSWWWWHHANVIGNPLFNLTSTMLIGAWGDRPEASAMRDFALSPDRWSTVFRAALPGLPHKWIHNFPHAVKKALEIPTLATGWLAAVGLAAAARDPRTRRLALCALLLALVPLASMTLTTYQRLYVIPFAPLLALGAALGARTLFERLPRWAHRPRAWIGALALTVLPSIVPALSNARHESRELERWLAQDRVALASRVADPSEPPRVLFSDTPDFAAWTTGRPTLWVSREEFTRLYPGWPDTTSLTRPPRDGLPARPAAEDTWFHVDPRDPGANLPRSNAP